MPFTVYEHHLNIACRVIPLSTVHLICRGSAKDTRGTAFVVYDDIFDAKNAVDNLSGFNVANRYLIVLYYNTARNTKKVGPSFLWCSITIVLISCHTNPCSTDWSWPAVHQGPQHAVMVLQLAQRSI